MLYLTTIRLLEYVSVDIFVKKCFLLCFSYCYYVDSTLILCGNKNLIFGKCRHNGEITGITEFHISEFGIGANKLMYYSRKSIIFHTVSTMVDDRSLTIYEKCQFKPNPP